MYREAAKEATAAKAHIGATTDAGINVGLLALSAFGGAVAGGAKAMGAVNAVNKGMKGVGAVQAGFAKSVITKGALSGLMQGVKYGYMATGGAKLMTPAIAIMASSAGQKQATMEQTRILNDQALRRERGDIMTNEISMLKQMPAAILQGGQQGKNEILQSYGGLLHQNNQARLTDINTNLNDGMDHLSLADKDKIFKNRPIGGKP